MRVLVAASLAYDTIMVFEGKFTDHILAEQTHKLNVAFLTPQMKRFRGGCAGNIAYSLKALGGEPVIMATVGEDFNDYHNWLTGNGFDTSHIRVIDDQFTAQAFVTSDLQNNQITVFHPGAMNFAHLNHIGDANDIALGIIGPDSHQAMLQHVDEFAEAGIPFFFDPGQAMPQFSADELLHCMNKASYAIMNDYESQLLIDKTRLTMAQLADMVEVMIVTHGSDGSDIYTGAVKTTVAAVAIEQAADPTGCGDAYRGGLLYGLALGLDWQDCARLGSLCGAIKIEHHGPQNHFFQRDEMAQRYRQAYQQDLPI